MWELRWILLGLGALLILGLYLWGSGGSFFGRRRRKGGERIRFGPGVTKSRRRAEPRLSADDPAESESAEFDGLEQLQADPFGEHSEVDLEPLHVPPETVDPFSPEPATPAEPPASSLPEKIVALRFVPREHELNCAEVVKALRAAGLRHGRYGIFHRLTEGTGDEPLFSVANLTEPGSFDLTRLKESTLPGMSFFLIVPGAGDPVERFDDMVETARSLAHDLDAELLDDSGSSWSIQRERYLREELIQYRHELGSNAPQIDRQMDGLR